MFHHGRDAFLMFPAVQQHAAQAPLITNAGPSPTLIGSVSASTPTVVLNPNPASPTSVAISRQPSLVGSASQIPFSLSSLPVTQVTLVASSPLLSVITSTLVSTAVPGSLAETPSTTLLFTSQDSTLTSTTSSTSGATALPATSPQPSSSEHNPPFYIGIVLAVIFSISFAAALVAWLVRLRRKHKTSTSHESPSSYSWDPSRSLSTADADERARAEMGFKPPGTDAWVFSGDRDVGEPRRQTRDTFVSGQLPLAESVAYPLPLHAPFSRSHLPVQLPTDTRSPWSLAGQSVAEHSASSLGPLQVANLLPGDASMFGGPTRPASRLYDDQDDDNAPAGRTSEHGTPREKVAGARPRFLSLDGNGLSVPWAPLNLRSTSFTAFSRRSTKNGSTSPWKRLPTPGASEAGDHEEEHDLERGPREERLDSWTASLRSNLVNAFNTVAASLPGQPGPTAEENVDGLTPAPKRHSAKSSIDESKRRTTFGGEKIGLSRASTARSTTSTAWTLEEIKDGAGVVHIRGLGLQYPALDEDKPAESHSRSSVSSDDTFGSESTWYDASAIEEKAFGSLAKPVAALLAPGPGFGEGALTRASSVYSTDSAVPRGASHSRKLTVDSGSFGKGNREGE